MSGRKIVKTLLRSFWSSLAYRAQPREGNKMFFFIFMIPWRKKNVHTVPLRLLTNAQCGNFHLHVLRSSWDGYTV